MIKLIKEKLFHPYDRRSLFMKYLTVDNDVVLSDERKGGFGSGGR